ncbi:MAG: hypothetical protein U1A77_05805 [Pirellulales bacterium]
MAIDTPARLAVLGAGPLGLEAAIYARFLGYDVEVFERGRVAEHVRQWAHLRMFSPFQQSSSPLGVAAISAQDENYRAPGPDELLTGAQWLERYLEPLAATDLLADHLRLGTRVLAVGRAGLLKGELADDEQRGDYALRMLVVDSNGVERVVEMDGVIDATGVMGQPNPLGESGIPAIGERATAQRHGHSIDYRVPDILGVERQRFAGRHTVVVGAGHSAATSVTLLIELAAQDPATRVTWIVRAPTDDGEIAPMARLPNDAWPERDRIATLANQMAAGHPAMNYLPGVAIHGLVELPNANGWRLTLLGIHAGEFECDRVIVNTGYRPDLSLSRELHIAYSPDSDQAAPSYGLNSSHWTTAATESPPNGLAPPHTRSPNVLREAHYHVVGAKSFGRAAGFTYLDGLKQIRELFALLGDRPTLDLYAGAQRLPR